MSRPPIRIAIVGAESTGKSTLAHAMAGCLRRQAHGVAVVDEALREWCQQAGRAPHPREHAAIALAQERLVDSAASHARIVIADTTGLMVLVYGGLLFEGSEALAHAREAQRRYDLTLLTGLDLPWAPDGLHRVGPEVRDATDALLREQLRLAGAQWHTVYGRGEERTATALDAVAAIAPWAWTAQPSPPPRWQGVCESCADAECEHRLFRKLLDARS